MNNLRARDRSHLSSTPEPSWRSSSGTPAGSGRSSPRFGNPSGHRFADDLEGQNDEALAGLTGKVKILKELSLGIGQEVRESAIQLSHMNDAFTETGGILSGTFRRMNAMATRQGGRWACYMIFLVIVFWIFVLAWLFR
ncbi:related to transport protein BET1-Laccaria bicolor [Serendipita indica DSM 11827]|uniref:Related to transport protein BET1-Laccaria bicolor n=1 Tax=Serendipita indica (strain DSM 11827) TaxID=1109443 RepID=G4TX39_SERID|nr:related to transport protein BET1-Laccaria bicolor [Serendipita indica DSM 11827]